MVSNTSSEKIPEKPIDLSRDLIEDKNLEIELEQKSAAWEPQSETAQKETTEKEVVSLDEAPARTTQKEASAFEKAARDINVFLPIGNLPLPIKIIALLTSIGGLSILANILTDIVSPEEVGAGTYFLRLITGLSMVGVSYGLIHRERWSLWVYGFIVGISILINPVLAFLPFAILAYLYTQRDFFRPSVFDAFVERNLDWFKGFTKKS